MKWAQWFWRSFINFVNVFPLFCNNLPVLEAVALHFRKIESLYLYPRMLCATFGWNWHSCSGDFSLFRSGIFDISLLIHLGKGCVWSYILTNLNPLYQRILCARFGPVVLETVFHGARERFANLYLVYSINILRNERKFP